MTTLPLIILLSFIPFVWLTWKQTALAITLVIASLPAYLLRYSIFGIPTTLLEIMIILLFSAWGIKRITTTLRPSLIQSSFLLPTLWFFLASILAILFSSNLQAALGAWKAYIIDPLLFAIVFVNTIKTPQEIRRILGALGITAVFLGWIATEQSLGFFPSPEPWMTESPQRVTSLFPYPNAVGLYLAPITSIFLGLILFSFSRNLFVIGAALFSTLGAFLSVSRGAIFSIIVSFLFLSFFHRRRRTIWLAVLLTFLFLILLPATRSNLLNILTAQDVSTDVRVVLWRGTLKLLQDHPLEGAGLSGFPILYDRYRLIQHTELPLYPHNIFLTFWTELGLLGLIAWFSLVVLFFIRGIKLRHHLISFGRVRTPLSLILMGAMVSILAYGLVDVPYFKNDLSVFFWFLVALMEVVGRIPRLDVS